MGGSQLVNIEGFAGIAKSQNRSVEIIDSSGSVTRLWILPLMNDGVTINAASKLVIDAIQDAIFYLKKSPYMEDVRDVVLPSGYTVTQIDKA